jgi:hypothetical protein
LPLNGNRLQSFALFVAVVTAEKKLTGSQGNSNVGLSTALVTPICGCEFVCGFICIPLGTSIRTHTTDKTLQFGPISLTANIYASVFIQGFQTSSG